jgi:hypothetical protein
MRPLTLQADYYQQFDADLTRDVPGEGYGGWQRTPLTVDLAHTALVVMHAWETGRPEQYPGWHRAVEYMPRAQAILDHTMPALLAAVRGAGMTLLHVVAGAIIMVTTLVTSARSSWPGHPLSARALCPTRRGKRWAVFATSMSLWATTTAPM